MFSVCHLSQSKNGGNMTDDIFGVIYLNDYNQIQ